MRTIIFYIFTIALFLELSSCCTLKQCLGFNSLREIRLINFAATDVDSIAIEIFESSSNFTNRIDSSFTEARGKTIGDTDLFIFMPELISKSHDYRITLISTGQVYKVTGFETRKEACNSCFPYNPPSDYFDVLDSYSVDGQKQNSQVLVITK
jgi:hypothetical protein